MPNQPTNPAACYKPNSKDQPRCAQNPCPAGARHRFVPHAVLPLTVGRGKLDPADRVAGRGADDRSGCADRPTPGFRPSLPTCTPLARWPPCRKVCACPTRAALSLPKGWSVCGCCATHPDRALHAGRGGNAGGLRCPRPVPELKRWAQRDWAVPADCGRVADALRRVADHCRQHRGAQPAGGFCGLSLPFLTTDDKQQLLETPSIEQRLEKLNKHLAKEIEVQQVTHQDPDRGAGPGAAVAARLLSARADEGIQKELGEQDEGQREVEDLRKKIDDANMPEDVKKEALKELSRLGRMSPMAADYSLTRKLH